MNDKKFKLYTSPISANGRKVLALTYYLNLDVEINLVNVYKGEGRLPDYLSINPFGKIPTLQDGDFILWESNAILEYIAEQYANYQLYSRDPQTRANIARWLFWESSHFQPAATLVLAGVVGHELVPEYVAKPTEDPAWHEPSFHDNINYLDAHFNSHPFIAGDKLTIADFSIAGMMTYFRFAKFPFERFANLNRWYETIEALDAWKKTATAPWIV